MQAGLLRDQVYIQSRSLVAGDMGEPLDTWSDAHGPLWAAVDMTTGRENTEADQVKGYATGTVRLRYDAAITLTSAHRIRFGSRILEITNVVNRFERRRELVVSVTEKV